MHTKHAIRSLKVVLLGLHSNCMCHGLHLGLNLFQLALQCPGWLLSLRTSMPCLQPSLDYSCLEFFDALCSDNVFLCLAQTELSLYQLLLQLKHLGRMPI